MRLLIRTRNVIELSKSLDMYRGRGIIKPPKWVILYYFDRYQRWADHDKAMEILGANGYNWVKTLDINPYADTWIIVEEHIYGEILTEDLDEYKEARDKKRRL